MEAAARSIIRIFLFAVISSSVLFSPRARAYDEFSHEWITRGAFNYLQSTPHVYPETGKWIEDLGSNQADLENLLVRAVVDTDYHNDLWLSAWFHGSFDGGKTNGLIAMFTTMYHFLDVISPGLYWNHDGYSYRDSTQSGNDSYVNEPTLTVMGSESIPLGGAAPSGYAIHGDKLGVYDTGFSGGQGKWSKLFFGGNSASDAVFPPSYVPAETAYAHFMAAPRAATSSTESWTEVEHLVKGAVSNIQLTRQYQRSEIAGLPQYMDLLGIVIHLVQDTTVPHHVEDTSDRCHPEYERAIDQLACGSPEPLNYSAYYSGDYGSMGPRCGALYDPALVSKIITQQGLLDPYNPLSLTERMIQSALLTAQWDWRISTDKKYATLLPNGILYSADTCQEILSQEPVQEQAKYQFNLAVAETASVIELAAHQYETQHAGEPALLPLTLSWFRKP